MFFRSAFGAGLGFSFFLHTRAAEDLCQLCINALFGFDWFFYPCGLSKTSLDVPVQCPHDADAREHHWAAERCEQDQGFRSAVVFDLRKSRDVVAGVLKMTSAQPRAGDWLIKDARRFQPIHFRRSRCIALAGRIFSLPAASRNDRSASAPT
jgi:hypothetical protein